MLSKADSKKKSGESSGIEKFVDDIGIISRALHADKSLSRLASSTASSRSKSVGKSNLPLPKQKPKGDKNSAKDTVEKDKKSSIWSWKGLKALTHVKNRRFNCCFSLMVHSIEGLPDYFDDVCLVVSWKRRDGEQVTSPVRVCQGFAEFEERMTHSCSVYGSRSGPHHSAKYEAKHFFLFASVYDAPELDLGKHRMDLTRILPLTFEELEEEKSSGKWTTSFRLSGKAKGSKMNVSFGYVVIGNDGNSGNNSVPEAPMLQQSSSRKEKMPGNFNSTEELDIRRVGSLPSRLSTSNQPMEEIKDLHEILPASRSELSDSVNILYQKLEEEMSDPSVEDKLEAVPFTFDVDLLKPDLSAQPDVTEKVSENEWEISEFSVVERGIEELNKQQLNPEESSLKVTHASVEDLETDGNIEAMPLDVDLSLYPDAEQIVSQRDEQNASICDSKEKVDDSYSKESLMRDLETALACASNLTNEGLEPQDYLNDALNQEYDSDDDSPDKDRSKTRSLSLDDLTDLVADDFLNMLGVEHSPFGPSSESEPDSPRERLLRQFEKDALASGGLLNFDFGDDPTDMVNEILAGSVWETTSDDFHHSANVTHDSSHEMPTIDIDELANKTRASTLEDLETEALMREWGFNERAFQNSPPSNSGGFGSPIDMSLEDPLGLPVLAEGLGPVLQTQSGGFLRSMNPSLFKNAKNGGSLIMQVSKPVVVPAEMGSGVMDILQGLASVGIEKLSMQANKLMPLEDVTGKTIEQIAWEASPRLEGPEGQPSMHHEFDITRDTPHEQRSATSRVSSLPRSSKPDSTSSGADTEYVSLDDLAPLAMDKIEALSIEGLRIQSGMSDNDAPSNISAQSIGEFSALRGKTPLGAGGSIGLDGTGGLQLLDIKDNGEDVDGLMGLSLTLDEWMRLDSGEIDDEDVVSERTSKILAAHHATSLDQFHGRSKGDKRRGKGRKYGLLGNNFTVALMVQLRDPLRNYEPVGTPMLALIQVERVFVPPKPKIYHTVSLMRNSDEDEESKAALNETVIVEKPKEEEAVDEEQAKIPQYKITEVHVAGLKTEPSKKKLWGSSNNQQSGSRWLLANGMGKKNKHPLMKPKAVAKNSGPTSVTAQPGDTLWSISSRVLGKGEKWRELAALNPHIRNPNVIMPNETVKLR